ncbi:hypothetical protein CC78DRAFT_223969 [Lojkania enalia]|uniref:Uncharacterized protein n=1 Tax=Lojkania enalia TaxID=147567 RepID=A0A9P4KBI9_9PLEO|nr:hypothetical protein CC78DRAFT_223969 [Didymosphaeria enalia]
MAPAHLKKKWYIPDAVVTSPPSLIYIHFPLFYRLTRPTTSSLTSCPSTSTSSTIPASSSSLLSSIPPNILANLSWLDSTPSSNSLAPPAAASAFFPMREDPILSEWAPSSTLSSPSSCSLVASSRAFRWASLAANCRRAREGGIWRGGGIWRLDFDCSCS